MHDSINDPMTPEVLDPAPFDALAGDHSDDDAQAYEAEFEAAPVPPLEYSGIPYRETELKPTTKLVVNQVKIGTINGVIADPVMLFPADVNRISLGINAYSSAVRFFRMADSRTGVYDGVEFMTIAITIARSLLPLNIEKHNGAVWVYSTANEEVTVAGIAVTR